MIKNKKHLILIMSLALVVILGATGVAAAAGVGVSAFASVLYHAVSGGPKPTGTQAGDTQATTAAGKRTESESADALGETDETKIGATAATTAGINANGTPIDAAASASLQALGGAAAGSTGTGTGAAMLPGQTAIDATASASVTSPTAAGGTGTGTGGALVTKPGTQPGQPAVDATAAASLKVAVSTSGAAAGTGTSTSTGAAATQPPVDATAAASLPKPGSTTGTGATTAPATGTPTTQNAQLISKADAQRIAIATIGSTARVEEIELKSEHYPPVYEVKLIYGKAEYMVVIHAVTGAVISVGKDD